MPITSVHIRKQTLDQGLNSIGAPNVSRNLVQGRACVTGGQQNRQLVKGLTQDASFDSKSPNFIVDI